VLANAVSDTDSQSDGVTSNAKEMEVKFECIEKHLQQLYTTFDLAKGVQT